ncbi:hypothetical protein LTR17_022078 [Elasticomyces elasticus]|nr:hypothetical protein LTR17_022078 [Elasticomyces elasticus]
MAPKRQLRARTGATAVTEVPIELPASTSLKFRICGWKDDWQRSLKHDGSDVGTLAQQLRKRFGPDDDAEYRYRLLWHWKQETCNVQRQLGDLPALVEKDRPPSEGQSIYLHAYKVGLQDHGKAAGKNAAATKSSKSTVTAPGEKEAARPAKPATDARRGPKDRSAPPQQAPAVDSTRTSAAPGTTTRPSLKDNGLFKKRHLTRAPAALEDTDSAATSQEQLTPAREVKVKIEWHKTTLDLLGLDELTGPSHRFSMDSDISHLRAAIREAVVELLTGISNANELLSNIGNVIYQTYLDGNGHDNEIDLEVNSFGARFPRISDLFSTPPVGRPLLSARVLVYFTGSPPPEAEGTVSTKHKAVIDVDALVKSNVQDTDGRFVRVANFSRRKPRKPENVPLQEPIMVEIDPYQQQIVDYWKTHVWDFDDQVIGGFDVVKERVQFRKKYIWLGGFKGVSSARGLKQRIFEPVAYDGRVPSLPPLTFNVFSIDVPRSIMGDPTVGKDPGIAVVVRFISHLDQREAAGLVFHDDFQIACDDSDDCTTVTALVDNELRTGGGTTKFFNPEAGNLWHLELWVLPQKPAPQKLYRFEQSGIKPNLLKNFVSQASIEADHRQLYMEAHVWPNEDEDDALFEHHDEVRDSDDQPEEEEEEPDDDNERLNESPRSRRLEEEGTAAQRSRNGNGQKTKRGSSKKVANGLSILVNELSEASGDEAVQIREVKARSLKELRPDYEQQIQDTLQLSAKEYDNEQDGEAVTGQSGLFLNSEEQVGADTSQRRSSGRFIDNGGEQEGEPELSAFDDAADRPPEKSEVSRKRKHAQLSETSKSVSEGTDAASISVQKPSDKLRASDEVSENGRRVKRKQGTDKEHEVGEYHPDETVEGEPDTKEQVESSADIDEQNGNGQSQSPSSAETYRRRKLSIPDHVPEHLRI